MRVCFVLKLFSHTSLLMLLPTQMRRGISHGAQMISTTFLLNGISYFLLYLQNATNVLIVHRGVPLCMIWHQTAWWAAVYGVAQSRTRLKRLSSSSNSLSEVHECSIWGWLSVMYSFHKFFINILRDSKGNIYQPVIITLEKQKTWPKGIINQKIL